MSERIDLSQFETIPNKLEIKFHEPKGRWLVTVCEPQVPWCIGIIAPDYEPYNIYSKDKIEQEKIAKMFAKSPELIIELKRCYYEIDRLREYAKCIECGGQYIGPMDYGLHEWNHSEDCNDKASE